MAKKNIRTNYIQNLLEDKKILEEKLKGVTEDTIKNILSEKVDEKIKQMLTEDEDAYKEEEVDDIDTKETSDDETSSESASEEETVATDTEDDDEESGVEGNAEENDVWNDIEQYKGDDGEYDLTDMGKEDLIKVLKVMGPEDNVRIIKNDNGTITLNDDETEKEYIIDIDGTLSGSSSAGECSDGECENEFEIELSDDSMDESVNEENLGYTDNYQSQTAMTTPSNHEPANKSKTYSMDGGVPTGTEKPFAGTGDKAPFDKKVNETMTTQEDGAYNRGTGMVHTNTNAKAAKGRNASAGGEKISGTADNSYSQAQLESIKRKANEIFVENRQLKSILSSLKDRLEEAIVVNHNLGNIVKIVSENVTSKNEKSSILERFKKVRTKEESNALYGQISEELKRTNRTSNISQVLNGQISEGKNSDKKSPLYESTDLNEAISFMERLNKIK